MRTTNDQLEMQIISLLQKRDEKALSQLTECYGKLCQRIAYDILGSKEDAEECVSDAMMKLWNTIPPQNPQSLRAYLVTVVRSTAISRYRTEHADRRGGGQYSEALDEIAETLATDSTVENSFDERQLKSAIERFLDTLKPEARTVFMQRYFFADDVKTIAKEQSLTVGKVKMLLMRTRNRLKEYLEKEGLL